MTKTCTKCRKIKEHSEFYSNRSLSDGLSSWCKSCSKEATSKWAIENKEKNRAKATKWRRNNPEKEKEVKRLHYNSHIDAIRQKSKTYYIDNAEREKKQSREYYRVNKKDINRKNALYNRERRKRDLNFKLRGNLRVLVRAALKGKVRPMSTVKALGCSDLASYIRSTYTEGMTDSNYGNKSGEWSIDHILPLSSFNLSDPEQFVKANHYTNLRAMWHIDNIKKSNK